MVEKGRTSGIEVGKQINRLPKPVRIYKFRYVLIAEVNKWINEPFRYLIRLLGSGDNFSLQHKKNA